MLNKLRWLLAVFALCVATPAGAAPDKVSWKARLTPSDARSGESAQVVLEATIQAGWHMYSLTKLDGPFPTSIELLPGVALKPDGKPVQPAPHKRKDEGFGIEIEEYLGQAAFGHPVKVAAASGSGKALVKIRYQVCDESMCLPPKTVEVPVEFAVAAGTARPDHLTPVTSIPEQPAGYRKPTGAEAPAAAATTNGSTDAPGGPTGAGGETEGGLLRFLGVAFLAGFLALLTPCVFPMVPVTVSYFAKQSGADGKPDVKGALAYCAGIIGTFTALGLVFTLVFGATGIQNLARNVWVNVGLAVLFIYLALNLFGAVQLSLPTSWVEKAQSGTGKGGWLGPVAMGLVFSLTSFTCTVPFVGGLLAGAATGQLLYPTLGMLAFSSAFALPFFLLALFPQWLARLPRSGAWLVTVKAFMGFLELAAAVKFLSNADLAKDLGVITRPIFLSAWSTLFVIAGAYLFAWVRLPHDSDGERPGPFRLAFGAITLATGLLFLWGVPGKSLGELNAFLPPDTYGSPAGAAASGLVWEEDYDIGLQLARDQKKPVLLNFTGVTCTNCRWMESNMFSRAEIREEMKKFVLIELFTDREDARSARYQKLEQELYQTVALPLYAARTTGDQKLAEANFTRNPEEFLQFLRQAQQKFAESEADPNQQVALNSAP